MLHETIPVSSSSPPSSSAPATSFFFSWVIASVGKPSQPFLVGGVSCGMGGHDIISSGLNIV